METTTSRASRHTRRQQLDDPQDATVKADVLASSDLVRVKIGTGPGAYTADMPWASNGRLPAQGDTAIVITSPRSAVALVWASGDPVT